MIHRIVQASLRQKFLVLMLTGFIMVAGIISFQRMPVDAYPDLSPPQVELITQWPGHAAEEVERLVTLPLELQMNGVPHMVVMRSISLYGLSDIRLTFEESTDDYFARQIVFQRIADASLPSGVTPSMPRCLAPAAWSIAMCWKVPTAARRNLRSSRIGWWSGLIALSTALPMTPDLAGQRCSTRCCSTLPGSSDIT